MKAADWSSEGVFQRFYYRPQHSIEFGSAMLAASVSKSHVDMETIFKWVRSCNGRLLFVII